MNANELLFLLKLDFSVFIFISPEVVETEGQRASFSLVWLKKTKEFWRDF